LGRRETKKTEGERGRVECGMEREGKWNKGRGR